MCVEELVGGGFQYFCAVYPLGGNTIFICLSLSGGCTIPFQLMCTVQTQICCSRDYFLAGFLVFIPYIWPGYATPAYDSIATVGEIRVYWRADFQSGSRVLKKVF